MTVTVAPGMAAPESSTTWPVKGAVERLSKSRRRTYPERGDHHHDCATHCCEEDWLHDVTSNG